MQRRAIDEAHLRVAVLLSLALGVLLAAVVALLGEPVAEPVFGAEIAELLPADRAVLRRSPGWRRCRRRCSSGRSRSGG